MSINISSDLCSYYYGSQKLSETTRAKLLALGIDPTNVTSEAEAKTLIQNAQNKRQTVNKTENSSGKTVCASECEVLTKAKNLARKLGVSIKEESPLDEILQTLSDKINELADGEAANTKEYQGELNSIKSEYSSIQQNQNSMFSMLNMTANVNKFMLGL